MAAQDALQILMDDEAGPDQPGVTEHHGEQPDDALDARLVGELHLEMGEVDLGLLARRRLEANFEAGGRRRPQVAHHVRDRCIAAPISTFLDLAPQARPVKAGKEANRSRR